MTPDETASELLSPAVANEPQEQLVASIAYGEIAELTLERAGSTTLADQIADHIEAEIARGALPPGGRLPSWRDLAAQLGVARGTVRAAYAKLIDRRLLASAASAGTRVIDPLPSGMAPHLRGRTRPGPPDLQHLRERSLPFQMGVPAHDAFPATVGGRLHRRAVHAAAMRTGYYSDPRGGSELRAALAAHVAITRGVECSPEQIIVTTGYRSGLGMALRALEVTGKEAWVEDPAIRSPV